MPTFAVIIALLARRRGIITAALARPRMIWLGEISYAIYILHAPLPAWVAWIGQVTLHLSPAAPVLLPI